MIVSPTPQQQLIGQNEESVDPFLQGPDISPIYGENSEVVTGEESESLLANPNSSFPLDNNKQAVSPTIEETALVTVTTKSLAIIGYPPSIEAFKQVTNNGSRKMVASSTEDMSHDWASLIVQRDELRRKN